MPNESIILAYRIQTLSNLCTLIRGEEAGARDAARSRAQELATLACERFPVSPACLQPMTWGDDLSAIGSCTRNTAPPDG